MVRTERVTKLYRQGQSEIRALDEVSLEVAAGEFVSVMGPSGSGKSTLLHLIGGLDKPTSGEIYIEGRPISAMSDDELTLLRRRRIGLVFQFFNLLPTLSVEENIALPLLLDRTSSRQVTARVQPLLEFVGLTGRRSHRPDQLSGGEMQRVALARALAIDPVLLLADEPTGNLDSKTGNEVLTFLRKAREERGQTVIMVTHDERAAEYGDRLVTFKDGRVIDATPLRTPQPDAAARTVLGVIPRTSTA